MSTAILMVAAACTAYFLIQPISISAADNNSLSLLLPFATPSNLDCARNFCDSSVLEGPEGIWIYPEDKVMVLVKRIDNTSITSLPTYDLIVVDSEAVNIRNGESIGILKATPETTKYEIELFTERKNGLLLKPKSCLADLSKDGETLILKRDKPKFSLRFSLNPSTLLPKFWRILRVNSSASPTTGGTSLQPAVGMVKIYPSYDGNGSSRRSPRYL